MPNTRPTGVTIAAIINFAGSAFFLFGAAIQLLMIALQSSGQLPAGAMNGANFTPGFRVIQIIGVLILVAIVAWSTATAIGLLRMRNWARISQLIFASLLILIGIMSAITIAFVAFPLPASDPDPRVTQQIVTGTRVALVIFYILAALLGAWWVYYFTRRATSDAFNPGNQSFSPPLSNAAPQPNWPRPASSSEPFRGPMNAGRPLSISIIAALFLLGLVFVPLAPLLGTPFILFGKTFYGWHAVLAAAPLLALQAGSCYGLLKMRLWGRTLAILTLLFTAANTALMWVLPGSQQRFDDLMQQQVTKMGMPANLPMPHFPAALMALGVVPILAIELFFLIKEKPAFVAAEAKAATHR